MTFLCGPLLAQAITFSAGDRTEVRARADTGPATSDVSTNLTLQLAQQRPPLSWSVGYLPSFTWVSVDQPTSQRLLMQTARAAARLQDARTALELSQDLAYGQTNYRVAGVSSSSLPSDSSSSSATGTSQPGRSAVGLSSLGLVDQVVLTGLSSTSLRLMHSLTPRLGALASAGYSVSGGLNASSRASVPLFRSSTGVMASVFRLTREDDLTSAATGTATSAWDGQARVHRWVLTLEEDWAHAWSRELSSRLGVGWAPNSQAAPGAVAFASFAAQDRVEGATASLVASLRLAPVIDPRTGLVSERLDSQMSTTCQIGHTAISGGIFATKSIDAAPAQEISSYGWSAAASYAIDSDWSLESGLRGARSSSAGIATPVQLAAFFAVRYSSTVATF